MKNIGKVIKKYRQKLGWSQSELARQTNVTSAAISLIEGGNRIPSLRVIQKLAKILNLSIKELSNTPSSLTKEKYFYIKFAILRKLKKCDQELILAIAKRMAAK